MIILYGSQFQKHFMKSQLNILVIIVDVDLKPQVCEIDNNVIAMTGGKMIIFEIKDNFEIRKEKKLVNQIGITNIKALYH